MIKNERQYRITKAEAEKFERSLSAWNPQPATGVDPIIHAAQRDALVSQLRDLRRDLEEYDSLRSGRQPVLEVGSFEEFPSALVKARIAVGLSQKDLADRLGIKEQQIQKYEATDYSGASLTRMMEVVNALGIRVRKEVFLPTTPDTRKTLLRRLKEVGFDREFVERRLVPSRCRGGNGDSGDGTDGFVFHTATFASRVLGVPPATLLGADSAPESRPLFPVTRFKVPARANEKRLSAYTVYAHYLAMLLLEATVHLPRKPIPTHAKEIREEILATHGVIDLASTLRFIWDYGVPVLPLNDRGAFHGACWRIGGRNVIALKQQTNSLARWLHDSIHEFGHAGQSPDQQEFAVLEEDDDSMVESRSREEMVVNRFAADVLLDGRAEELAQACVKAASGILQRLKGVVPRVATREGVRTDVLANYMAYRLAFQGENWWGVATNLQERSGSPWLIARDVALEKIDFSRLNPTDRELLTLALTDTEG